MIPVASVAPGQPDRRSLETAHDVLMTQRYLGRPAIPLFKPKKFMTMIEFLGQYAPLTLNWELERLRQLWREVRGTDPETFLVAVSSVDNGWVVDRNIRTATFRVYHSRHAPLPSEPDHYVREYLWELRIHPDGSLVLRPYDNSGSEKLYWTELSMRQGIRRFLREELGFTGRRDPRTGRRTKLVSPALLDNVHFIPVNDNSYYKGGVVPATEFSSHPSERFPSLVTNNDLSHAVINLPADYYQPWYHERGTSNLFVFASSRRKPALTHLQDLGLTLRELGME